MAELSLRDVERIVHLVASAGDPTTDVPLLERKRDLIEGVAEMVDADMWMWNVAAINPRVALDVMAMHMVQGGWDNEEDRVAIMQLLTDPKFTATYAGPLLEAVREERFVTCLRSELLSEEAWEVVGAPWRAAGYNASLVSVYPLSADIFSGIGFHRRVSKPDFNERDRAIVHVVFQQVDWLHREGMDIPAGTNVVRLSPRQRQVLLFLLGGDSRKEIAAKLKLSEHTVGDYLKQLYKQFSVTTRGELLAHFISGGRAR